jgi:hypothetical protein
MGPFGAHVGAHVWAHVGPMLGPMFGPCWGPCLGPSWAKMLGPCTPHTAATVAAAANKYENVFRYM